MKKIKQSKQVIILILFAIILNSCTQEKELEFITAQKQNNIVGESFAKEIASNFLFNNNTSSKTKIEDKKIVKEIFPVKDEKGETLFYIINYEKKGFLILSADKRISPVFAYSDINEFRTNAKSYSPGLEDWLELLKKRIQTLRINKIEQTKEIKFEWDSFLSQRDSSDSNLCDEVVEIVGPLLSTTWHQSSGYKTFMPTTRSCGIFNPVSVGCVPLAIAQVMKYHNYPTNYNWSDMPDNSGTNSTAFLLKSIYDVIKNDNAINIGTSCTIGVYSSYNIARLFRRNFDYSTAKRSNYDKETIKEELRSNRPVILSGGEEGNSVFHTWVCDGLLRKTACYTDPNGNVIASPYNYTSLSFHMNWGWGGFENGWYNSGSFNPDDLSFNYELEMIHKIKP
jgi:hypothetical protein